MLISKYQLQINYKKSPKNKKFFDITFIKNFLVMKNIVNKINDAYNTKKILNYKQSIFFSYFFLIWYLLKPSQFLSSLQYSSIKRLIFYAYEIIPLISFLILSINSFIQIKKSKFKKSTSILSSFALFPLLLFLPIVLSYSLYILRG